MPSMFSGRHPMQKSEESVSWSKKFCDKQDAETAARLCNEADPAKGWLEMEEMRQKNLPAPESKKLIEPLQIQNDFRERVNEQIQHKRGAESSNNQLVPAELRLPNIVFFDSKT